MKISESDSQSKQTFRQVLSIYEKIMYFFLYEYYEVIFFKKT